jgi:hypothetical protein
MHFQHEMQAYPISVTTRQAGRKSWNNEISFPSENVLLELPESTINSQRLAIIGLIALGISTPGNLEGAPWKYPDRKTLVIFLVASTRI